jgi:hypothetical protein
MARHERWRAHRAPAMLRACVAGLVAAAAMGLVVLLAPIGGAAAAGTTSGGGSVLARADVGGGGDPGNPAGDPAADAGGGTGDPGTDPGTPPTQAVTETPSPTPSTPSGTETTPGGTQTTPGGTQTTPGGTGTTPGGNPTPGSTATGGPGQPAPTSGPPSGQPGPVVPGKGRIGIWVTTSDIKLDPTYWTTGTTVQELKVFVANTGTYAERVQLRYTLPAGLSDAGTQGCASENGGGNYRCGAWTAPAGARWTTKIKVRVSGDAWLKMPLSGSVKVLAVAPAEPSLGGVQDNEGFAVLFPPDPHVPGIKLEAGEVSFTTTDGPAELKVKVRNTSTSTAKGTVDVLLPSGVSVDPVGRPPTCNSTVTRTRCDLGRVPAGRVAEVDLTIKAALDVQRLAPLSGAVIATLDVRGKLKTVKMSFKITALAATYTPPPRTPLATGSQGTLGAFAPVGGGDTRGMTGVQKTAVALVVVSILLVVLAVALATTSLRRRLEDEKPPPPDAALPAD